MTYHYDPRKSKNQWSGGIAAHPAPNNCESKHPLKNSRLKFLGSRWHPPHWLASKGPHCQRGVLLVSAGAIEGHFEGKTPREDHQGGLDFAFLHRALATQKKLAYLGFQYVDHPTYSLDLAPSVYHLFLGLKKNWNFVIFLPTRR